MAAALTALLAQPRGSRSDSVTKAPAVSNKLEGTSANRSYSVTLSGRHQHIQGVQYRSMLDVEETHSLRPTEIASEESIIVQCESAIDGLVQKFKHTTASSDWADILCFYTATNGVAQAAPTRTSPAPNGKAVSPSQEVPQSVSSADPKVAAQQASDMRNIVRRKLTGYVGFANLPNQWHRKSVRKGFNFNVMVVGM
jgi:septin 7